jgi:imidazolonepropionase-like amidohydrolase
VITSLRPGTGLLLLAGVLSMGLPAKEVVIHAGRLVDVQARRVRTNVSIVIQDDRIVRVEDGLVKPAGVEVIDLSTFTVLPGLIDCHRHITMSPMSPNRFEDVVTQTPAREAIVGVINAKAILQAGFTSIRSVGTAENVDVALKQAIAKGLIPGPRLWVSGSPLGPTGGHSDLANGMAPGVGHPSWGFHLVDSPADARRAVREHHKYGVDLIKIMPSGGVGSIGDDPANQLMADDEIAAAVEAAHALGMRVTAHAHGKKAIDTAARLGVDSIDHGTYADAASFALMKERGTYLVPTVYVSRMLFEIAQARPESLPPHIVANINVVAPLTAEMFRTALRSGVKIAFGTDAGAAFRTGSSAKEFTEMVRLGMPPMDALVSATRTAAELLGADSKVGAIAPGYYADVIAVSGNPAEEITVMEKVRFVMKGGVVHLGPDGR